MGEERGNQKGDTNMAVICMQVSTGYFARLCVCMYGADPSLTRPVLLVGGQWPCDVSVEDSDKSSTSRVQKGRHYGCHARTGTLECRI